MQKQSGEQEQAAPGLRRFDDVNVVCVSWGTPYVAAEKQDEMLVSKLDHTLQCLQHDGVTKEGVHVRPPSALRC